ncbi:uncharacterized protein RSE6_01056 [Rhynchosporium secalis]|uniref:Uncharacterized protein n=1 Tax=Rhynchosporium secalis TaxID=38038 RepID=A0A1E1LWT2_RHYSE|nr:uncharacterized protein RSE6_01056 [Rhynchosporium secalis]
MYISNTTDTPDRHTKGKLTTAPSSQLDTLEAYKFSLRPFHPSPLLCVLAKYDVRSSYASTYDRLLTQFLEWDRHSSSLDEATLLASRVDAHIIARKSKTVMF